MKTSRIALSLLLLAPLSAAFADLSASPSGDYVMDKSHAYITFSYSHLGFSRPQVGFDSFDVSLTLDSDNVANSDVGVTIDAASINSRVDEFNGHLRSADFFNTDEHPEITFRSTSIVATGDDTYDITGDLTIKGITKPVTLATTINKAANHPMSQAPTIGISGETTVNRSEFDLGRFVPNVGDEVTIQVTAEFSQPGD